MNSTSNNWLVHDHDKYDAVLDECEIAADEGNSLDMKKIKIILFLVVIVFTMANTVMGHQQ